MISKRINGRRDGKSSAHSALKYGAGLKKNHEKGIYLDKSHRTRLGGFGLAENGVYIDQDESVMHDIIELASLEMQANCDLNTKVGQVNKIAHFICSFDQDRPGEAVVRDTEDSTLAALKLNQNHFATFLHSDNGHWHLHIFVSRISQDDSHCGNSLWRDRTIRDRVCREIEIRHKLKRDKGIHIINSSGFIEEISLQERKAIRNNKISENGIKLSSGSKEFEKITGHQSFQSWCIEMRIGDRLKHAKSWQELHQAASEYNCQIKQNGAGFVICPVEKNGGVPLSKIGLKKLQSRFGEFKPYASTGIPKTNTTTEKYTQEPTEQAKILFRQWNKAYLIHKATKENTLKEFRIGVTERRLEIRKLHKIELVKLRSTITGSLPKATIAIAKMQHAANLTEFSELVRYERTTLYKLLAENSPGANFNNYLVKQAQSGNEAALSLLRKYGEIEATNVSRQSEVERLKIVAAISGFDYMAFRQTKILYRVEPTGTVIFDLGGGRIVTDSAISKQIQLNDIAAHDPVAIETSLRFAVSKFGNTLVLTGPPDFQRLAVEIAVKSGLFVKFDDPALEQYSKDFALKIFNSNIAREKSNVRSAEKNTNQGNSSPVRRDSLYQLPERKLDSESMCDQMLLHGNAQINLGEHEGERLQGQRSGLRQPNFEGAEIDRASSQSRDSRSGSKYADSRGDADKEVQPVPVMEKEQESNIALPGNRQVIAPKPSGVER